jgi:peptidoglycan/xylan/chitin deacetylase (PgdA/CDA1 family)
MEQSLNVLVVGAGDAQSVSVFLRKIERYAQKLRVCGVIYQTPKSGRDGLVLNLLSRVRRLANRSFSAILNFVHGNAENIFGARKTELDELSGMCAERDWNLFMTSSCADQEVLEFARQNGANAGVVIGPNCLPFEWLEVLDFGWVWGELNFVDAQGHVFRNAPECAQPIDRTETRIYHTSHEREDLPLVSVELSARPLDTGLSLKLKSDLIIRDLIIETMLILARNEEPRRSLSMWVDQMMPLTSVGSQSDSKKDSGQLMPAVRIRAKWKLLIYLLIEFSPLVICRNWVWRWRKKFPVIILAHHLISDSYHHLGMPTDTFFRLVRFLKKYYRIVGLTEAISRLKSGSITEPTVVLTFDDGYEENFLTLRAVAEEMDISVTMFVSPGLIEGRKEFDHDLKKQITGFRALSWAQVRYWSREKVDFGSHTHSHFDCGSNLKKELEEEIVLSKTELEKELGRPIFAFAFPFGKRENMSEAALELAQTNYEYFASCHGGVNFPFRTAAPKHLLRKALYTNFGEVELDVQGVFDLVRRWTVWLSPSARRAEKLAPRMT